jgi:hypothetical protein
LPTALEANEVTIGIDTNIVFEFTKLHLIPWKEIAPNAERIRLIVPNRVGEEIDRHKNEGSGRLKRRAVEFQSIARQIEQSRNEQATFQQSDLIITIEFAPIVKLSELDGETYDISDSDGRIVAELAWLRPRYPDLVLLSDDSKPLRLARQSGLAAFRPPETWRLPEGPDERDKTIANLQRQLGAHPTLLVSILRGTSSQELRFTPAPREKRPTEFNTRLVQLVLDRNPKTSRAEIARRYGIEQATSLVDPHFLRARGTVVTLQQLKSYEEDYARFSAHVSDWARSIDERLRGVEDLLPITVQIENSGTAVAEHVVVHLVAEGALEFASWKPIRQLLGIRIAGPKPPRPYVNEMLEAVPARFLQPLVPDVDPYSFHRHTEFPSNGRLSDVEFRCAAVRHNTKHTIKALLRRTKDSGAIGRVLVRTTAANIADAQILHAPVRCAPLPSEDLASYLADRLDLFSDELSEVLREAIEQP